MPQGGRIIIVGAGKAAAAMARATEKYYAAKGQGDKLLGFVTTRQGRSRLALDVCGKTHADVPLRARQTILISATTLL